MSCSALPGCSALFSLPLFHIIHYILAASGRPPSSPDDGQQDTRGDGRTDHSGHVRPHGVHEQEIVVVLFQADAVEMKLFAREELEAHASEAGPAMFRDFIERQRPSCGELPGEQLEYLFGPQAGETGSVALIPVQK